MRIGDKVMATVKNVVGTIVRIRNGYYFVDFADGDSMMFLESEIYPVME